MKVLITGATGLIGKELTKLLIQKGFSINYLTTSEKKITSELNFKGFYWNPKKAIIDEKSLDDVAFIFHLAGANIAHRWTKSYKKEILESRILSSNLLFNTLKKTPNQIQKIISASGTSIYPNHNKHLYNENYAGKADGFLSNVVQEWEKSVNQFISLGIKVCVLRTGIVYSKDGGALVEIIKPIKLGIGSSLGSGEQIQSWVHINDLVNIYLFVITNQLEGVYNAVSPNPISYNNLIKTIAKLLNKHLFMPNIPKFLMQFLFGEMHELLFTNKKISSQKIINKGFVFQFPDINVALKEILKNNH